MSISAVMVSPSRLSLPAEPQIFLPFDQQGVNLIAFAVLAKSTHVDVTLPEVEGDYVHVKILLISFRVDANFHPTPTGLVVDSAK